MLLACYSHKHISYRIRTIIRKAIQLIFLLLLQLLFSFLFSSQPQFFNLNVLLVTVSIVCAASYNILLHSAGPIFDMLPCRSTSPEEYCLGVNPIYPSCGLANEVKLRNAAAAWNMKQA